ncbi:MAG: TRAM domain-containing protein, partial [Bacteroidota bacterium]
MYFRAMKPPVNKGDILENARIEEMTLEGKGIVRVDRFVIFVEGGVPGDIVDIRIDRIKKKHAEARIQHIHTPSVDRVSPSCTYFGTCGGCKMQNISYPKQLSVKEHAVQDA